MKYEFRIREENRAAFDKRFARLVKRAEKLGFPPFVVTFGETITEKKPYTINGQKRTKIEKFIPITLEGEYPVINGWSCVARIEHLNGANLVHTNSDDDFSKFRERKPVCEHCGHHKIRVVSYVLKNEETGELKQVGKSCIKDFIDADPEVMLKYASDVEAFESDMDDLCGSERIEMYYDVEEVLAAAFYDISERGYHKADSDHSTAVAVATYFHPPLRYAKDYDWDLSPFADEVKAMVEYWKDLEPKNNFEHVVKQLIVAGDCTGRHIGYLSGAAFGWIRMKEKEVEKAAVKRVNEWVGEIKERREFKVVLESVFYSEGYYGTTAIHRFRDDEGHTLVWFASNAGGWSPEDVGAELTIVGTIKKHDEYKDWKQTVITRVKEK